MIIDFHHATAVNQAAAMLLAAVAADLVRAGRTTFFTRTRRLPALHEHVAACSPDAAAVDHLFRFASTDQALEWCEDELLRELLPEPPAAIGDLRSFEIAAELTDEELAVLGRLLVRRRYSPGELIIRDGEAAANLFLVIKGLVGVWLGEPGKGSRVASFSAGTMVGELAVIDGEPRSANVVAEGEVECGAFAAVDLLALRDSHPRIYTCILRNIAASLATKLRRANHLVGVLSHQPR